MKRGQFSLFDPYRNLTSDGRWTYTWDGENRLIEMKRDTDTPAGARQRMVFEYDHQGRRIRKQFYTYSGGWQEQTDTIFLYDGWNLMGELDANASKARVRTFVWGLDLSGTMDGAGGVGGLLKVTDYVGGTTHHFVAYDGNGNVAALTDAGTGALTARYDYGPFGEPLRATGAMALKNPLRFSTKYTDNQSGFLYYGYRFYSPTTGRWLSRDPFEERGGVNLYTFAVNNPVCAVDIDGRQYRPWPGNPPYEFPGKPPEIDCSGYRSLGGQKCKTCFGMGSREDTYPEKAGEVCEGFKKTYTGSEMQAGAACVADCLIAAEKLCQMLKW